MLGSGIDDLEYMECDTCRSKPGSPDLCAGCLNNRTLIGRLEHVLSETLIDARKPVPMILTCPSCSGRHIDEGDFAAKPHHTHACQHCGMVWRPALVPTVGVQFLPGFKNG